MAANILSKVSAYLSPGGKPKKVVATPFLEQFRAQDDDVRERWVSYALQWVTANKVRTDFFASLGNALARDRHLELLAASFWASAVRRTDKEGRAHAG